MIADDYLCHLPHPLKLLVGAFVIVLTIGYFTALSFVHYTTSSVPSGIMDQYTGNEDDEDADVMKFRKSDHEMLNITHTHILSMSLIFFITGFLTFGVRMGRFQKKLLIIEPFASIILTFGGIYLMWSGLSWMVYIVMVSGIVMTVCLVIQLICIFSALFSKPG